MHLSWFGSQTPIGRWGSGEGSGESLGEIFKLSAPRQYIGGNEMPVTVASVGLGRHWPRPKKGSTKNRSRDQYKYQ